MYLDHEWQCSDLDDELHDDHPFDIDNLIREDFTADANLLSSSGKSADDEGKVSLDELRNCFHLSRKDAAQRLGISVKHLNRVKKEYNIEKWPHRKVKLSYICGNSVKSFH